MPENQLTEGRLAPAVLKFAVPYFLSCLLQALYGAVDLMIIGRFASTAAQSAVATGTQVMTVINGITLGLATGVTVVLGNRIGAKDDEGAAAAVGSGTIVMIIIAIVMTPIVIFATNPIVSAMQVPAEAVVDAQHYIFTCACGIPLIIGYLVIGAIYRGLGDSKTPLLFIFISVCLNIIGDLALVGGLHLSALGAAIATVGAQAISFFLSLIYMKVKKLPFRLTRESFRFNPACMSEIVKIGTPLALQDALSNVSFLFITAIVNSISLTASASVGIVEKIIFFVMLPSISFSSAVATIAAQNIGAGKPKRALDSVKLGILFSLIFGVAVFIYCQFLPTSLTQLFSKDSAVVHMAGTYLRTYAIDCMLVSFVFPMNSYFSGLGHSLIVMFSSLGATFLVRIPISYIMSKGVTDSLIMMGFAPPSASICSIVILSIALIVFRKKKPELFGIEKH